MASSEMPSLSLRHGIRVQPDPGVPVESVLLAIGECVGHANLSHASRMNRGLLVFLKEERLVAELVASGVLLNGVYLQVFPLAIYAGYFVWCPPIHPQPGAGARAAALREAREWLPVRGTGLQEREAQACPVLRETSVHVPHLSLTDARRVLQSEAWRGALHDLCKYGQHQVFSVQGGWGTSVPLVLTNPPRSRDPYRQKGSVTPGLRWMTSRRRALRRRLRPK